MKLVTYVAGSQKPRVGMVENGNVIDAGFDGDMVAFIEAGAPTGKRTPVEDAQNALTRLGRPIPNEWYEVPAYYKGMPDTVTTPLG